MDNKKLKHKCANTIHYVATNIQDSKIPNLFHNQSITNRIMTDTYNTIHITTNTILRQYIRTINTYLRFTEYYIQGSLDSATVFYVLMVIQMCDKNQGANMLISLNFGKITWYSILHDQVLWHVIVKRHCFWWGPFAITSCKNLCYAAYSAGNGRSHSRQMRPNISLGDEILP